jgi:hypothetical protein
MEVSLMNYDEKEDEEYRVINSFTKEELLFWFGILVIASIILSAIIYPKEVKEMLEYLFPKLKYMY